jgi:peptidoglycan/LPS O-acetylase OafA/YrhL
MNIKKLASQNRGYMIQLDSIRAIAVLSVMFGHFTPTNAPNSVAAALKPMYGWFPGVALFFVLSGFLITGILLRLRDLVSSNQQSLGFTLKRFYVRRFLRIFPIYYLTLFVTAAIFKQVRSVFFWHLTYTTNIMLVFRGEFDETSSHFWSLSMEEQFYLVWPCIILLTPEKHLYKSIVTTIILAIIARFGGYCMGLNVVQINNLPLTSLDTLGLGSLLAFFAHHHHRYRSAQQNLCTFGLWICLPVIIFFDFVRPTELFDVLAKPTIVAFFYVWLINRAAIGFSGTLGKVLEFKPLIFIGKISYGIYVIHYFMSALFMKIFEHLDLTGKVPISIEILLKVITTFALAIPAWFWVEQPINNLKHRFSYEQSPVVKA